MTFINGATLGDKEALVMRIITYDRFKSGVTLATIEPYLPEEVANVWRLWKAGIVRENYASGRARRRDCLRVRQRR
jgi:hypothetical protein